MSPVCLVCDRLCEERRDEAIRRPCVERFPEGLRIRAPLDCFAALAMTAYLPVGHQVTGSIC
jgi:hypothetical protein